MQTQGISALIWKDNAVHYIADSIAVKKLLTGVGHEGLGLEYKSQAVRRGYIMLSS